jgi:hypothetical protein
MTLEQRNKLLATVGAIDPAEDTRSDQQKVIDNVLAGGYSAANSALMGLPDYLVKSIGGSEARSKINQLRRGNEIASTVGDIGGAIGSMFIAPEVGIAKVGTLAPKLGKLGSLASKIGKTGEFLKGTELTGNLAQKIGQGALRGAGQSTLQAVPRAAFGVGAADTDQERQAAMLGIPVAALTGGVLGGTLGPLANKLLNKSIFKGKDFSEEVPGLAAAQAATGETKLQKVLNDAREAQDNGVLRGLGTDTRTLRKFVTNSGLANPSRVEDAKELVSDLAKIATSKGIKAGDLENLAARNKADWDIIDQNFIANAPPKWGQDFANKVASDSDLLQNIDELGTPKAQEALQDILKDISNKSNLPSIKSKLQNISKNAFNSQDPDQRSVGFVANQIRNKLNDYTSDVSGLPKDFINNTKQEFKLARLGQMQDWKDTLKIDKTSAGSDTFPKAAISKMIGNAIGSGGAGGAATSIGMDISQGNDVDLGKAGAMLGGGLLLGGIANKAMPRLIDASKANSGRLLSSLMSNPANMQKLENVSKAGVAAMPGAGARLGGTLAANAIKPAPNDADQVAAIDEKEQALPAGQAQQAKQEFTQKFAKTMNTKLTDIYNSYYSDDMTPEDFLAKVSDKTNGYQDMGAVADILYYDKPKEKDQFLRRYDAHLALKNLDIDKAIKGRGTFESVIGLNKEAGDSQNKLVNTLTELLNEGDPKKDESNRKAIKAQIANLQKDPTLMRKFINEFGLDFSDLKDIGLA